MTADAAMTAAKFLKMKSPVIFMLLAKNFGGWSFFRA